MGKTISAAERELSASLLPVYDQREAASITNLVMEKLTGWPRSERVLHKSAELHAEKSSLYNRYLNELLSHKPVQYVLGEAWFCGLKFYVNENVLIPRPETEELVAWVQTTIAGAGQTILDIGTGTGCIAIALKQKMPSLSVIACDISEAALAVAKKNADFQKLEIDFRLTDILNEESADELPMVNYIVSNPPYIPASGLKDLDLHVSRFEPAIALFVPDENPLLFYKAIEQIARKKLLPGGFLFFEIHEDYADLLEEWFISRQCIVEIRKDLFGKKRMAKLILP